jgi:hypothetical protein
MLCVPLGVVGVAASKLGPACDAVGDDLGRLEEEDRGNGNAQDLGQGVPGGIPPRHRTGGWRARRSPRWR